MKIAILNDSHFGARGSSETVLKYQRKFYEDTFFPYCKKHGIKELIHLGDYFDNRKAISVKAIYESRKMFLEPFRKSQMRAVLIPGNHDVLYKNTNNICSLKELLGYYINNIEIVMHPKEVDYDGYKIGLLPWINNENYEESMEFITTSTSKILCAHLELANMEMMKGVQSTHGMDPSMFNRFKKVLTGHYHTKSSKGNIHYLGTQYQLTWADCNDPKYFHIFDTESERLTKVLNSNTLFEKIFYNDEKNDYSPKEFKTRKYKDKYVKIYVVSRKNGTAADLDNFIHRLQKSGAHDVRVIESYEDFEADNISDENINIADTKVLMNSYVDSIETDLDKNRLKSMLTELLIEAQNEEAL